MFYSVCQDIDSGYVWLNNTCVTLHYHGDKRIAKQNMYLVRMLSIAKKKYIYSIYFALKMVVFNEYIFFFNI